MFRSAYAMGAASIFFASILVGGCATYRIQEIDSDPLRPDYQEHTLHSYFWGLEIDPQALATGCGEAGINDVEITRSYAHDLASVLSLGIWMPLDVRYRCKAPPVVGGTFPD